MIVCSALLGVRVAVPAVAELAVALHAELVGLADQTAVDPDGGGPRRAALGGGVELAGPVVLDAAALVVAALVVHGGRCTLLR